MRIIWVEVRNVYTFWWAFLKGKDNFLALGIEGRTLLNLHLNKQGLRMWTGFVCLRILSSAVRYEQVMKFWVLQKTQNFLIK
jgi:hypothetical protein